MKIRVAHIFNTANVAYYYSHILKTYGVESTVYQKVTPRSVVMSKIMYGYESGNPLNVDLGWLSDGCLNQAMDLNDIRDDFDIVELHEGGGLLGSTIVNTFPCKRIAHFHGTEIRVEKDFTSGKWLRKQYFRYGMNYDRIVLSTPDLVQCIWKGADAVVLLNPIDPTINEFRNKHEEGFEYIFYPTRQDDAIKSSDRVFAAWRIIRESRQDLHLVAIRWGRNYPEHEAETKGDDRVIWIDPLTRRDYIAYLKGAALVLGQFKLPAHGLIELEAIFAGKPLVSYHFSGIDAPSDIANEVLRLLNDDAYRESSTNKQLSWVKPFYDNEKLGTQLYDIYRGVMIGKS
ncbi:MAG: hypothetical protein NTV61_03640 [Candidatus Bathyarchaeota archaeon]|nr:hypothetical protein [Candidatus Bathyarchaeota archaeon]